MVLALVACGGDVMTNRDPICGEASWRTVDGNMDRSALAIWGTSDDNLYVVGGPLGSTGNALFRHWDGKTWTEIETGTPETLWWVWGAPDHTDVWAVGEHGTILRWDGSKMTEVPSGTAAHLYGVWGSSSDDVWFVGGRPGPEEGPDDVVLHWNGHELMLAPLPDPRGAALFKVWGAPSGDVWITGEAGTVWHGSPSGWKDESLQIDTYDTLATVSGCSANEVYTVGGQSVYRYDGTRWSRVNQQILAVAAGVSCGENSVLVVGSGGLKLRLDKASGVWTDDTLAEPYDTDFHGAWVSPEGTMWAAGGNYIAPASQIDRRIGILAKRGCE